MRGSDKTTTYAVQVLRNAYGGRIPWDKAETVLTSRSVRRIRAEYRRQWDWYHPQSGAWSGHVRIIGDGYEYAVEGSELVNTGRTA